MKTIFLWLLFFVGTLRGGEYPPIHVFIHVCTINHWQEVLKRQLDRMEASGLYEECSSISLGVLGDGDLGPIRNAYPKLSILFQNPDTSLYERPTLLSLHALCLSDPSAHVLYLHTKGVSREASLNANIIDWCRYMEYFAVERWKECQKTLKTHDTCGVNWHTWPHAHFSGNFWWATAAYISTLPHEIGNDYYDPEMWLGRNSPKYKCFHESNVNHYFTPYPESEYTNDTF